ncbi:hypothetical protein TNCV_4763491 [Trichonephila clavipes]|nr:hypothetical protein TNCV_4763491 [Trichonephila clavipes]
MKWSQVVFSDESRFNFGSDDNRVRVWRPRGAIFEQDTAWPHTVRTNKEEQNAEVRGIYNVCEKCERQPCATREQRIT